MPDAETAENIYGDNELASTLYFFGKAINDGGYTIYRNGASVYDDVAPPLKKWMKGNAANAPLTAAQRASGLRTWPRADVRRPAPLMRPRNGGGGW
jgi:hypothetical protein